MRITKPITTALATAVLLQIPAAIHAEPDPAQVVREMLDKLRSTGDESVVLEYAYWPEVYKALQELGYSHLASEDDGRRLLQSLQKDPAEAALQYGSPLLGAMKPEDRRRLEERAAKEPARAAAQDAAPARAAASGSFHISGTTIRDDKAWVTVITEAGGRKTTSQRVLQRIDGKWYLSLEGELAAGLAASKSAAAAPSPER